MVLVKNCSNEPSDKVQLVTINGHTSDCESILASASRQRLKIRPGSGNWAREKMDQFEKVDFKA